MVVSHVVHPYSLESATTPAWIACGQTGWKPGFVSRLQNQDSSPSLFLKSQLQTLCL